LLLLPKATCLVEKQTNTNFIVFDLTRPGFEPTALKTSMLTITPLMRLGESVLIHHHAKLTANLML